MNETENVITFYRARLDEEGAVARATTSRQPYDEWDAVGDDRDKDSSRMQWGVAKIARMYPTPAARDLAVHIARQDPAHTLRRIEAARRSVKIALAYEATIDGEWGCCHSADAIEAGLCPDISPNGIELIKVWAAVYDDHPDFKEEWRP